MNWFEALPASLRERAYVFQGEPAWERDDAVAVLGWASIQGHAILGIEVWLPTSPAPTVPGPYIWDAPSETASANRVADAVSFVQSFEWDAAESRAREDEPYFNLTFAEDGASTTERIAGILIRHDPMALFYADAGNFDEYQPEAKEIAARLESCPSPAACTELIREVFAGMFGEMLPAEIASKIAEDIWRLR